MSSTNSTGYHANQRCHSDGSCISVFQRITTSLALRWGVSSWSTHKHFADLWTTSYRTHSSATPSSSHHRFYPSHCRLPGTDTSGHPCARIDSGVLQERHGRSWQSAQELFSSLGWFSYYLRARLWKRLARTRWVLTLLVSVRMSMLLVTITLPRSAGCTGPHQPGGRRAGGLGSQPGSP